jgi:hypothetical protein
MEKNDIWWKLEKNIFWKKQNWLQNNNYVHKQNLIIVIGSVK